MKKFIYSFSFVLLFSFHSIFPQGKDTLGSFYYQKGIEALSKNDTETAKDIFKSSIKEKDNAPAEFELAKIYRAQKSNAFLNLSRLHIKAAVELDPKNIEYRLFYASLSIELYNDSFFEFNAWGDAVKQYNKVIELDSTNSEALEELGELEKKEFEENNLTGNLDYESDASTENALKVLQRFNSSNMSAVGKNMAKQIYDLSTAPIQKSEKLAQENFKSAENALLTSIRFHPASSNAYYELATLYEENKMYDKGCYYLKKYTLLKPDDEKGHLYLGMFYYQISKMDSSNAEYIKAISLMSPNDKTDFQINSVKILLEPLLGDKIKTYSDDELKQIIKIYWEARDPLYLSAYNIRLLEHYSRVTYANLWFGEPDSIVPGWKTDRGMIMIRYGFPSSRLQLQPGGVSYNDKIKTEIWTYPDKTFAFTDELRNGHYLLAQRGRSQYWDSSQDLAEDLKKTQPEEYNPKFQGPAFNVPFSLTEFKDQYIPGLTDIYVSYGIKFNKDSLLSPQYNFNHNAGLFFFDKYYKKLAGVKASISYLNSKDMVTAGDSGNFLVNSLSVSARPDSGNFSFELINNSDQGAASYHFGYKIENYAYGKLEISDMILASKLSSDLRSAGTITRKNITILPNPLNIFESSTKPYIYYELYNLKTNSNGNTNFTQEIVLQNATLKEKGISLGKIIGSMIKFVSKGSSEYNVSISSNYQTSEKDPQMYLQIDMSGYAPGNYILTVNIKDNLSGEAVSKSVKFSWK